MQKQHSLLPIFITFSLSLGSILFALMEPVGVWGQSGIVGTAMRTIFALNGIALIHYYIVAPKADSRILNIASSPCVLSLLLLAVWSALSSPFQDVPMRNLYGSQEIGEGVLWFAATAQLIINANLLYRNRLFRKYTWYVTLLILSITSILHFTDDILLIRLHRPPYYFPDYLAFLGLFMIIITLYWATHISFKKRVIMTSAIVSILLLLSDNMSAFAFIATVFPFVWLTSKHSFIKKHWTSWSTLLTIAASIAITAIVIVVGMLANQDENYYQTGHLQTLVSRYNMLPIIGHALIDDPITFLFGKGWGSYGDQHIAYLATDKLDLVGDGGPRWEGIWRHHFHSHHTLAEALISAGVPGLLILLSFFVFIGTTARKYRVITTATAIVYTLLATQWFQLSIHYPFIAMMIAGANISYRRKKCPTYSKKIFITIATLVTFAHLWTSYSSYKLITETDNFWENSPEEHFCDTDFAYDDGRGGMNIAKIMRSYSSYLLVRIPEVHDILKERTKGKFPDLGNLTKLPSEAIHKFRHLSCIADHYINSNHPGVRLQLVSLLVRSDVALSMLSHFPEGENADFMLENWGEQVSNFITRYPKRTDQALPYMLWKLNQGDEVGVYDMAETILEIKPNAPEGLWFKGIVLLNNPNYTNQAIGLMRRALELGIDRLLPLDEATKQAIQGS